VSLYAPGAYARRAFVPARAIVTSACEYAYRQRVQCHAVRYSAVWFRVLGNARYVVTTRPVAMREVIAEKETPRGRAPRPSRCYAAAPRLATFAGAIFAINECLYSFNTVLMPEKAVEEVGRRYHQFAPANSFIDHVLYPQLNASACASHAPDIGMKLGIVVLQTI